MKCKILHETAGRMRIHAEQQRMSFQQADILEAYLRQVEGVTEVKVYDPNKKQPWQWKKIPGHERNEALDCRNYALAAFKALPKNLDEIDRRLKEAGGERAPAPVATPVMPPPAAKQRPKRRSGKKYYDDW